ncbi:MAG TPA: LysR family transcriptional regulator [Bryobacteraceae bacterium]
MSDLNSLIIFAQVVDANGFSKAARRLKMPTSTVSRRIAELEQALGVRLIERSTRSLRLTDVGSEVLEYAHRGAEINEAIENIASSHLSKVSGNLRLAAPPSISDSLLAPIVVAFQKEYPDVHIQVFITERIVDQIAEGVDLAFRVGELEDSSLVALRILAYRHQLVASPEYLQKNKPPKTPQELLSHRLLAFSFWRPENTWNFIHANGKDRNSITFKPYLAINEYDAWRRRCLRALESAIFRPSFNPSYCDPVALSRSCRRGISGFSICRCVILAIISCPDRFACSRISPPRWRLLFFHLSPRRESLRSTWTTAASSRCCLRSNFGMMNSELRH